MHPCIKFQDDGKQKNLLDMLQKPKVGKLKYEGITNEQTKTQACKIYSMHRLTLVLGSEA